MSEYGPGNDTEVPGFGEEVGWRERALNCQNDIKRSDGIDHLKGV